MIKQFIKIFWSRAQIQILDVIIDILLGTLQEFRRSSREGNLDVNRYQDQHNNNPSQSDKNPFSNLKY